MIQLKPLNIRDYYHVTPFSLRDWLCMGAGVLVAIWFIAVVMTEMFLR